VPGCCLPPFSRHNGVCCPSCNHSHLAGYRAGYPPHPDARNVERARAGPPPSSTTHGAPPRRRSRSRSPPHPSSSARAPPAPDYTSDYMRPKTGESTAAAAGRQLDSRDARPDHRQGPGDGGYGHGSAPAGEDGVGEWCSSGGYTLSAWGRGQICARQGHDRQPLAAG
jgi:hypothetical protein